MALYGQRMAMFPNFTIQPFHFYELHVSGSDEIVRLCLSTFKQGLRKKSDRALFTGADQAEVLECSRQKIVCQFMKQGRVVAQVTMLPPTDYSRMTL